MQPVLFIIRSIMFMYFKQIYSTVHICNMSAVCKDEQS